jgi:Prp8 binding protein
MIWDLQACDRAKKFKGHLGYVNSVDVSRQMPQLICSGGDDNLVKVWDRRKKGEAASFDSTVQVLAVSFNETADQVITGGIDNDIKVWDIRKNALLYRMKGHIDCPTGLSLSPDGSYIASNAMDNTGKIL